ncbi:MAG: alpha/beta hydrolase fold domain-containing protein, partial [Luminiphilus sp.]
MKPLLNQLLAQIGRRFYRYRHFRQWGETPVLDVAVSNLCVDIDGVPIQLRMYHGTADRPLVIFYHGGGWVVGDLDTHDRFCRGISNESGCSVVSV